MAYSNQLKMVVNLIGPQAAIRLSRQYGGRSYRVPKHESLHDMHPLVCTIGMTAASALSCRLSEESIKLPHEVSTLQQIRDSYIWQRACGGESLSSIACDMQIDRKLVQKVMDTFKARGVVPVDKSQGELL